MNKAVSAPSIVWWVIHAKSKLWFLINMFNKLLLGAQREWLQDFTKKGGIWAGLWELAKNSSGPVDETIRKSQEGQSLRNFRVEEALVGSVAEIPAPLVLWLKRQALLLLVFLCCSMSSHDESLHLLFAVTPGTAVRKPQLFTASFPCLWLPPPFALPFSKQHMLCLCAIYWAGTSLQAFGVPLQLPLLTDLS